MEYATLGNTSLLVSKLCFGTMTLGDGRGLFRAISTVGQAEADELVLASIDGGVNFFDTADNYTEGQSEKILGQLIPANRPLCPHLGTARYRAWQTLASHPDSCGYNNLQPPTDGMPVALPYCGGIQKTRRKRLNDVVC